MFAQIYECSKCGDVWRTYLFDHIDTENDEIHTERHCSGCNGSFLKEKKDANGVPYMHPMTDEEIRHEIDSCSDYLDDNF